MAGGKHRGEEVQGMLQVSLAPHCWLCVCSSRTFSFCQAQTSPDELQALKLYGYGTKVDGV